MIVVTGVSHHTAGIEIRERVALSTDEEAALTRSLLEQGAVGEVFVVSTCNRVEIIATSADDSDEAVARCESACRGALLARAEQAEKSIYSHRDLSAVRHLMRVASSLDSLVVGEAQILGQMKQGFERARTLSAVGSRLHQLFVRVSRGAKRVRNETSIGMGQVSVPSIAIDLAGQIFGDLRGRKAVLIGAGDMGQTVARLLSDLGAQVSVVGRSLERVQPVADKVGGRPFVMDALPELLLDAEVVVSSTSATTHVLTEKELAGRRKKRRAGNLFCIDLAVPRDIDPAIGKLDGVFLYDVDDLSQVAAQSAESRKKEAAAAETIVAQVVDDWERHTHAQQVTPTIKSLRARMRLGLEAEFDKSLRGRLRDLNDDQRAAVAKMLEAGINRILHHPVTHLRAEAARGDSAGAEEFAGMLSELFDLQSVEEHELDISNVRVPRTSGFASSGEPARVAGGSADTAHPSSSTQEESDHASS